MTNRQIVQELYPKMVAEIREHQPMTTVPLCPLCLQPFVCEGDSPSLPTADHIVPGSVGGAIRTLTCKHCNNTHGATLDSHLKKAIDAFDFLSGKGTLPAIIGNSVGRISANLDWNDASPVKIDIIGEKASHPAAIEDFRRSFPIDREFSFTLSLGFIPEAFWRAVLRVGYMVAFHQFGYAYALSKGGAQVREAISGRFLPNNVILSAYPSGDLEVPFLVHRLKDGILVLFRGSEPPDTMARCDTAGV
jgi:hypothetical protein